MANSNNEIVLQAVERALLSDVDFYCYRLPNSEVLEFGVDTSEKHTNKGFCVYPFSEDDAEPCFITNCLDAECFLKTVVKEISTYSSHNIQLSTSKQDYLLHAERCIAELQSGKLSKVVLSRTIAGRYDGKSWCDVFKTLLSAYPGAFVFIFKSLKAGAWLGATPERFLSYNKGVLSTMALAGTRLAGTQGEWGNKELEEQKIVADYIQRYLDLAKIQFEKSETYTRNAGNVEHICTDFEGINVSDKQIYYLRKNLHPTPAIAGTPTNKAIEYIRNTELHSRRYYGGYIGPMAENGDFDFFVNLRSLEFRGSDYCLYVGGGLTADSDKEKEWQETAEKARTLQRFL